MTVMIRCDGPLRNLLRHERLDTVEGALRYNRGELLTKPGLVGRRRRRLRLTDDSGQTHTLYLKCYDRERFWPALWRWVTTGRRISRAAGELAGIDAVRAAKIETMTPLAYGEEASWLRRGRGYLLVTAVEGDALERCADEFLDRNAAPDQEEHVERLTTCLGGLVGRLHAAGCAHRDLYASHVFLHETDQALHLSLIDLARVFRPRWRMRRWQVKDVAQVKYSMPARWVDLWWNIFLGEYARCLGRSLPEGFAAVVDAKVAVMTRRQQRREGRS